MFHSDMKKRNIGRMIRWDRCLEGGRSRKEIHIAYDGGLDTHASPSGEKKRQPRFVFKFEVYRTRDSDHDCIPSLNVVHFFDIATVDHILSETCNVAVSTVIGNPRFFPR